ncbi:MAG: metal ABC transporter permease [Lachnospiraceae bacterium]|nr:metal ABC transporter permease [Lachnospiraceae bacterium]
MLDKILFYLNFPFVQHALIAGVLIAMCAALLGVILVLKRFSYIGDGLSHVAFGGLALATVLKLSDHNYLIMPVTILAAIVLLRFGSGEKLHGDAALAIFSVSALAVGYLLMNVFSSSANISGDVCTTLFGSTSILTLTIHEVWVCIIMSVVTLLMFCLFYHRIFSVTFDESFARASGIRVRLYQTVIAIMIAIIIVLAMNLVGSLLITALMVFPALSAMQILRSFRGTLIYAALISMLGAGVGILISMVASTPVGATIVIFDLVIFLIHVGIGKVWRAS